MTKKLPAAALDYFRKQGARGGKIGGAKSWAKMTAEERSARAAQASRAATVARKKKAQAKKVKD